MVIVVVRAMTIYHPSHSVLKQTEHILNLSHSLIAKLYEIQLPQMMY